eukprot:scaffold1192_cov80-Skeletonema_marinoi.AAC.3
MGTADGGEEVAMMVDSHVIGVGGMHINEFNPRWLTQQYVQGSQYLGSWYLSNFKRSSSSFFVEILELLPSADSWLHLQRPGRCARRAAERSSC